MKRNFDASNPEWMDRPQPVSAELKADLENLILLNRWFGSYSLVWNQIGSEFQPARPLRMLDLATGAGDIPRELVLRARKIGTPIEIVAVDFAPATLEIARGWSIDFPEIRFEQGDARSYENESQFDGVLCSLALHHFTEADAVEILSNMRKLSKNWFLAADLLRGRWNQICIWILTQIWLTAPMTRNDARVSIERAFSFAEFEELAKAAGWKTFTHKRFPIARQAVFGGCDD